MPRRKKICPELTVRVALETTRFSSQYLIAAYERLAPSHRRALRTASSTTARTNEVRTRPGQGGKHA
jgi:hypothetical protein